MLQNVVELFGVALIVGGVAALSIPAGVIVAGISIVVFVEAR